MEVEISEENEERLEFDLEGASPAFANALRRTMMGDVPVLSIEDVIITENNSGLFDEILAHRLGLLPWSFDPDNYNRREECDCEDGCEKCTVHMVLTKEGPGNVVAGDIVTTDDEVEAVNPDTKIVELHEGSSIDIEAVAQLGTGKEHAKWQAANASYSREDGTFHFKVESLSGLEPREIVSRALDRLETSLDRFDESLSDSL